MVEEVQLQGSSFFFSGSCTVDGEEGGGFGWRNLRLLASEDPEAGWCRGGGRNATYTLF